MSKHAIRSTVVEARQFMHPGERGDDHVETLLAWANADRPDMPLYHNSDVIFIPSPHGTVAVTAGGYIVKGSNGEVFSQRGPHLFEAYEAYEAIDNDTGLTFGTAIELLKLGNKVYRCGWSSREFIVLMLGLQLSAYNDQDAKRKVNDSTAKWVGKDTPLDTKPYIAKFSPEGNWQPGWVAGQDDLLAEDWRVSQ